jgi:hypothetical protein
MMAGWIGNGRALALAAVAPQSVTAQGAGTFQDATATNELIKAARDARLDSL